MRERERESEREREREREIEDETDRKTHTHRGREREREREKARERYGATVSEIEREGDIEPVFAEQKMTGTYFMNLKVSLTYFSYFSFFSSQRSHLLTTTKALALLSRMCSAILIS